MVWNFIDLTGKRFGRLTVLERADGKGRCKWRCLCSCGNEVVVLGYNLKNGNTQSCGCLMRERAVAANTTHGEVGSRLYRTWQDMKKRCLNPNVEKYPIYGGRGITVCREWLTYEPFRDWALANGYAEDLTIDRIDNNGGYEPRNCRWATSLQQDNNRRSNRFISFCGEVYTLAEWARILGISYGALFNRLKSSKSIEEAFTLPVQHQFGHRSKRREALNA